LFVVHVQHLDRSSSGGCPPDQVNSLLAEVLPPRHPAWREQLHGSLRYGIDAGEIWTFELIAPETREAEIRGNRRPQVLTRHDVIDFK
jgi:hypothetical protein